MQILNSGYSVSPANYSKPTPKWIKLVADLLLLISMLLSFPELPDFPGKNWVVFGGLAAKFISKFISDHISEIAPAATTDEQVQ